MGTAACMVGTESRLDWYQKLDKPRWRPPPAVFGVVWTPMYALAAVGGARALDHMSGEQRRAFARTYAVSLALSAGWSPLFFGARSPRLALADVAALDAANVDLLRRAWRADRLAAACLTPYVAWITFVTALTAAIARRNRTPSPVRPHPLRRSGRIPFVGPATTPWRSGRPGSAAIVAW